MLNISVVLTNEGTAQVALRGIEVGKAWNEILRSEGYRLNDESSESAFTQCGLSEAEHITSMLLRAGYNLQIDAFEGNYILKKPNKVRDMYLYEPSNEKKSNDALKGIDDKALKNCRRCGSDTHHEWIVETDDTGEGHFECIECGNEK
ncbi:MAG: hypothetical protein EOP04_09420 [Proteobacteria bacterium]|nr:MAG: hypothetical protein EOP04_09420 [Pseudomonadota bacterium]